MKDKVVKIINNDSSADVLNLLETSLLKYDYNSNRIIHYTFLIEEALILWREVFPGDSKLKITETQSLKNIDFSFEISGDRCNPFAAQSLKNEDQALTRMVDRLLSGVGNELKYRYIKGNSQRTGVNKIILRLPKKNHEDNLYKNMLLTLMIPLALQGLVENLSTSIDTFMLGYVDSSAMSAVALASQFNNIHMLLITAVTIAVAMLTAQFWGIRDRNSIKTTLKVSTGIGLIISIFFFALAFFMPRQIMSFYTDIPGLIDQGSIYLRHIAISYLIIPVYRIYYSYMRVTGSVNHTLLFAVTGCIVNAVLNAVFIFGCGSLKPLGIRGAALATVISAVLQIVLIVAYSLKNRTVFNSNCFCYDNSENISEIRKLLIKKSGPVLLQFATYIVGINIMAAAYGHMGASVTSANALIATVTSMFLSLKGGIGNAAGLLIGSKLGRNEMKAAWHYSEITYKIGVWVAIITTVSLALFVLLLRLTPLQLTKQADYYLMFLLIAVCINSFFGFINAVSINGCLFAGGDSVSVLVIDGIVMGLILIPLSLMGIFTNWIEVVPLMMILKTDEVLSFPLKLLRVKRKKWLKNITEDLT